MKIIVLEGSPNQHGSSNMLADQFIRGVEEAGHTVKVIDAAHADIHPCIGCIHCGYEGPCVQKDDVEQFRQDILEADMEQIAGLDKDCPSMLDTRKISEIKRVYDYLNNPILTSL